MIPFERELYIDMLAAKVKEQRDKSKMGNNNTSVEALI